MTSIEAPFIQADPISVLKNIKRFRTKKMEEVIHVTGDIHYAVFAFPRNKTILTIHDCVFLYYKKGMRKLILLWFWLKLPVRHARYITTISEASKRDILTYTGCDPKKVKVIPDPVDPAFIFSLKDFNQSKPVILHIGTGPNKNLERVIEAVRNIPCHLYIIGKLLPQQQNLLNANGVEFSNHFRLSKEELIDAYRTCDMVVYMSTFEGFGLPIVEAQASGRPLITSNIAPMNEVAGKGAHLADPYSIQSIREGILKVILEPAYREQLTEEGLRNLLRFDPEKIAGEYYDLYQSVAHENQQVIPAFQK